MKTYRYDNRRTTLRPVELYYAYNEPLWALRYALAQYEPRNWQEKALIPYWLIRWLLAWLWSGLFWLWIRLCWKVGRPTFISRHNDPTPMACPYCLWTGPYRWLYHGYEPDGDGSTVAVSYCPRCENEL